MEAPPSKTYTLLTSIYNDVDDAAYGENANDYNRVIGISKCEQNFANAQTHPHTYIQTDRHPCMGDFNKLSAMLSLKMKCVYACLYETPNQTGLLEALGALKSFVKPLYNWSLQSSWEFHTHAYFHIFPTDMWGTLQETPPLGLIQRGIHKVPRGITHIFVFFSTYIEGALQSSYAEVCKVLGDFERLYETPRDFIHTYIIPISVFFPTDMGLLLKAPMEGAL